MGSPGSTRGPKAVTVSPGAMRGSPRDLSASPGGVLGPQGVCHHPQGVCQRVRQRASVSRSPASVPRERARFPGGVPGPPAGRAAFPGTVPGSRRRAGCWGRWQVPGAGWRREIRRWRGGTEPLSGAGSPGCSQEMGEARGGPRRGTRVCSAGVPPCTPWQGPDSVAAAVTVTGRAWPRAGGWGLGRRGCQHACVCVCVYV